METPNIIQQYLNISNENHLLTQSRNYFLGLKFWYICLFWVQDLLGAIHRQFLLLPRLKKEYL